MELKVLWGFQCWGQTLAHQVEHLIHQVMEYPRTWESNGLHYAKAEIISPPPGFVPIGWAQTKEEAFNTLALKVRRTAEKEFLGVNTNLANAL